MESLSEAYAEFVIPTYGRFDLDLLRGAGCSVWDEQGRRYLDMGAGIAVCSLGHAHPEITAAISQQAATLVHTSNLYRTVPQADLARRLVEVTGPGKVFFCNSGAEANEGLMKLARRFGSALGRFEIITFSNSFHGRTLGCISATGQTKVKKDFGPLLPGFAHVRFGDLGAVRGAITPQTVAILVEPVQGEGGIHLASPEFLRGLRDICDECDLLLLFDEVQCGLGRTGNFCGWRSITEDVEPDAVSWAKGIANGFPLGAFWASRRDCGDRGLLCDLLGAGSHGTTYGGNAVACRAGLAVMDIIARDHLLEAAVMQGAALVRLLQEADIPYRREVRALGLMVGLEFSEDFPSGEATPAMAVVRAAMAAGLLIIPAGDRVVRFLPPLNVSLAELSEAVEKLTAAISGLKLATAPL